MLRKRAFNPDDQKGTISANDASDADGVINISSAPKRFTLFEEFDSGGKHNVRIKLLFTHQSLNYFNHKFSESQ